MQEPAKDGRGEDAIPGANGSKPKAHVASLRILLVESEPGPLATALAALRREGFDALGATTQVDALAGLRCGPDLVFCATEGGDLDGFALCSALRDDGEAAGTPMFLIGSGDVPHLRDRAKQAGADDLLLEPLYVRDLCTLAHLFAGRRLATSAPITGDLARTPLFFVLRALLSGARGGILELPREPGSVAFHNGHVVAASAGGLEGEAALNRLVLSSSGPFSLRLTEASGPMAYSLRDLIERDDPRKRWIAQEVSLLGGPGAKLAVDFAALARELPGLPAQVEELVRLFDGIRSIAAVLRCAGLDLVIAVETILRLRTLQVLRPVAEFKLADTRQAPRLFEPRPDEALLRMNALFPEATPNPIPERPDTAPSDLGDWAAEPSGREALRELLSAGDGGWIASSAREAGQVLKWLGYTPSEDEFTGRLDETGSADLAPHDPPPEDGAAACAGTVETDAADLEPGDAPVAVTDAGCVANSAAGSRPPRPQPTCVTGTDMTPLQGGGMRHPGADQSSVTEPHVEADAQPGFEPAPVASVLGPTTPASEALHPQSALTVQYRPVEVSWSPPSTRDGSNLSTPTPSAARPDLTPPPRAASNQPAMPVEAPVSPGPPASRAAEIQAGRASASETPRTSLKAGSVAGIAVCTGIAAAAIIWTARHPDRHAAPRKDIAALAVQHHEPSPVRADQDSRAEVEPSLSLESSTTPGADDADTTHAGGHAERPAPEPTVTEAGLAGLPERSTLASDTPGELSPGDAPVESAVAEDLPNDAREALALLAEGRALYERGQARRSLKPLLAASTAAPANPEIHLLIARANLDLGRSRQAARSARRALEIDEKQASAHLILGAAYQEQGRLTAARYEYRNYLRLEPHGEQAREIRALLATLK